MSPRDSCFWMETDRADGFYESCHRMRVCATEKGWRRSFSFFLAFFFWLASPSVLRRSERKGRNTASWSLTSPPPPRRFWKEGLSQNASTCSYACVLHFRFCMPACHLRRRSLTWSQLIPGTPIFTASFVPESRGSEGSNSYKIRYLEDLLIRISSGSERGSRYFYI